MKPFDLDAAMRGEPCITRGGTPARVLGRLKNNKSFPLVVALMCDDSETSQQYDLNGKYELSGDSVYDLFMAPKTKKLWIAINTKRNMGVDGVSTYQATNATSDKALLRQDWEKALLRQDWKIVEIEVEE